MVFLGQSGGIWGKVVVFRLTGGYWAKVVVFEQSAGI